MFFSFQLFNNLSFTKGNLTVIYLIYSKQADLFEFFSLRTSRSSCTKVVTCCIEFAFAVENSQERVCWRKLLEHTLSERIKIVCVKRANCNASFFHSSTLRPLPTTHTHSFLFLPFLPTLLFSFVIQYTNCWTGALCDEFVRQTAKSTCFRLAKVGVEVERHPGGPDLTRELKS